ncbi:BREX-1 system adenine-specific DNA-methyltransferase PglX [Algibacter sp. Ld11]|uniref:BREX-1 system adenine-specific DNA-methyltransferase PglX n=1 Tax=Algibacter sp. Ld11 TaxID=649150 RepID=UPI0038664876
MNTKTFAQEARKILMQGVAKKLLYWGFNDKGEVLEQPEKVSGGYSFRGEVFDDPSVPNLWKSLQVAIKNKGIEVVVEEAAYTWFNRIMALRILVKNGYEEPQLEDAPGLEHTPIILQKARQGKSDFLTAEEKNRLQKILADYSKDQEAFAILIKGYCHSHKTLQRVFGKIDDYTELLLPDNMLQTDGFLHLLNTTDAINDEDYKKVELIGWLYQFYISEKKDEVFKSFNKGKKAEAKDIPAATQIFTPNWIVKYMVENTAGKIWLDKHPNSALKNQMKYLVENDNVIASDSEAISSNENDSIIANKKESSEKQSLINNVEELTLIDPAAGSGHILVEGFDLIYKMYLEEYYTAEEAVQSILKNNLFGLDIDDRAAQLATFAILLKAAQVYPAIWTKDWLPNVYAMPEAANFSVLELKDFLGEDGTDYIEELDTALSLMKQAKNLGSVMKLDISEETRNYVEERFNKINNTEFRDFNIEVIFPKLNNYIPVLLLLTKKYTSVVANPPYMHRSNMNKVLKDYVFNFYPKSKTDLFAVFIETSNELCLNFGYVSAINQQSWMFISSYDELRMELLDNFKIENLIHLGLHVFKELNSKIVQSVAFVLKKEKVVHDLGVFIDVRDAFGLEEKEKCFANRSYIYKKNQRNFMKIPGATIAYWIGSSGYKIFDNDNISDIATIFQGMITGDNKKFVRSWFEVDVRKINLKTEVFTPGDYKEKYWVGYSKGGESSKWFGNQEHVVNFSKEGKDYTRNRAQFSDFYFREYVTWSYISLSLVSRYFPKGYIWDVAGSGLFLDDNDKIKLVTSLLSSKVGNYILGILNPTLNYQVENIAAVPVIIPNTRTLNTINILADTCISLTKDVYDNYEISPNFMKLDFVGNGNILKNELTAKTKSMFEVFKGIHSNEEELNKLFINLYELESEVSPDVHVKDITAFGDDLKKANLLNIDQILSVSDLPVSESELLSQFISYAIGLFMGRYRLDKPGLNIAHPNPTAAELESYSYNNGDIIIDEDAILPLMGTACSFPDDALQQVYNLLDVIWGAETRTDNINFIQECLNKDLEKFLVADFYKYHCKKGMYNKKPIYWLFASKKGAFQVLVYMHRMNAFTVEKIRDNYLLEHIKNIDSEITLLSGNEANLSTQEAKKLEQLRKDLQECYEYEAELKTVADNQITFDLDDGVTVNYKKFETVVAKIK